MSKSRKKKAAKNLETLRKNVAAGVERAVDGRDFSAVAPMADTELRILRLQLLGRQGG